MASVKISELNTLISITSDDFIPIVDSGSGTTYRATFNVLNNWMAVSASCLSASYALTASYARSASYAVSSSWANNAMSSSYALTASYYNVSGYTPVNATSASFATTASSLQGNGLSWERDLRVSHSLTMASGSALLIPRMVNRIPPNDDGKANSIWFNTEYGGGVVNDYSRIYYMEGPVNSGRLYFDIGDDIDAVYGTGNLGSGSGQGPDIEGIAASQPGFLFSSFQSDGYYASASLFFIRLNGKVYGRGFEARDYSQSLVNQVGFFGTASCAVTAAYALAGGGGGSMPVGAIIDYAGAVAPAGWAICDGSELLQASYPDLYAVLATTWGVASNPVTLFKLPNLQKRTTFGANGALTKISGSLGNYGGSEAIAYHYHAIGKTLQAVIGSGISAYTTNDDFLFPWIGNQTLNGTTQFPQITGIYGAPRYGGVSTGNYGPGVNPIYSYPAGDSDGWMLGTSFALAFSDTNTDGDMMPPYAVVNKIIRIDP